MLIDPASDDVIRHLKNLEGDAPIQRLLQAKIEESIPQRLGQIKVPTAPVSSDFGDDGHPMAKLLL